MGFYRGLVPKLLGETCQTLAVGAVTYFVSHNAPTIELKSLLNISFSVMKKSLNHFRRIINKFDMEL